MKWITLHSEQQTLPQDPVGEEPNWKSPQLKKSGYKPQAVPTLKQTARLCQARMAHHCMHGVDKGSDSRGRRITFHYKSNQDRYKKSFLFTYNHRPALGANLKNTFFGSISGFFFLFQHFGMKTIEKAGLTGVWSAQHLNTGQNIQPISANRGPFSSFVDQTKLAFNIWTANVSLLVDVNQNGEK